MDGSGFERRLAELRAAAEAELRDLERERRRLQRLIALADEYRGTGRSRRARPRAPVSLLRTIRERPGTRASMLASLAGRPFEQVEAELAELEGAGKVKREGLGWSPSDA